MPRGDGTGPAGRGRGLGRGMVEVWAGAVWAGTEPEPGQGEIAFV